MRYYCQFLYHVIRISRIKQGQVPNIYATSGNVNIGVLFQVLTHSHTMTPFDASGKQAF